VTARPPRRDAELLRHALGEDLNSPPWPEETRGRVPPPVESSDLPQLRPPSSARGTVPPPRPREAAATSGPFARERPPAPRPFRLWTVLGIAAVLLAAAVALVVSNLGPSALPVVNLAPGEQLYIEGVRADPAHVNPHSRGSMIVSTAQDGRLRRFGTASHERSIDVRTLPEVPAPAGSTGALSVASDPASCRVEVDGKMVESLVTPLQMKIDAGREMQLIVYCPNLPVWSRWVMAVPGQEVKVAAKLRN